MHHHFPLKGANGMPHIFCGELFKSWMNLIISTVLLAALGHPAGMHGNKVNSPVFASSRVIRVSGSIYKIRIIRCQLSQVKIKVGLARGCVGRTESLGGIALRYHAIAAIDGCFFEAYDQSLFKNPDHTLITDGQVVHIGNVGTLIGFESSGNVFMGLLPLHVLGERQWGANHKLGWFAYWINQYPSLSSTITLFTPFWGASTDVPGGVQIVVNNGMVSHIGYGPQAIPSNGYVIYLGGTCENMAHEFYAGQSLSYSVLTENGKNTTLSKIQEGLGCGPRLIQDGKIVLDPESEGFTSPKILYQSGQRSAVGVTKNNDLLLVTSDGTMREMARIMQSLGCQQAMNLDGGASSGLWYKGKYLTRPGRNISNALLVIPR